MTKAKEAKRTTAAALAIIRAREWDRAHPERARARKNKWARAHRQHLLDNHRRWRHAKRAERKAQAAADKRAGRKAGA